MPKLKPWIFIVVAVFAGCRAQGYPPTAAASDTEPAAGITSVVKTDKEWRNMLTPEQHHILREAGTERPFTSELLNNKAKGTYACAGCGLELFSSETKFDSGSGWPSFYAPIAKGHVLTKLDESHGMIREENVCAKCGGHLGHVFPDGPKPTGLRYCINGLALKFVPDKAGEE